MSEDLRGGYDGLRDVIISVMQLRERFRTELGRQEDLLAQRMKMGQREVSPC